MAILVSVFNLFWFLKNVLQPNVRIPVMLLNIYKTRVIMFYFNSLGLSSEWLLYTVYRLFLATWHLACSAWLSPVMQSTQNIRFPCRGCTSLSAHFERSRPFIRITRVRTWGLTSRLAAHLVQTAAGADAAQDDDEEKDSNATETNYHWQFWVVEVIQIWKTGNKKQDCWTSLRQNNRNIYFFIFRGTGSEHWL